MARKKFVQTSTSSYSTRDRSNTLNDTHSVGSRDTDSGSSTNSRSSANSSSSATDDDDSLDEEDELGPVKGKWPFGGKGRTNDVPLPPGKACGIINKLLAQVKENAGEFTFGGLADSLPSAPGICVNGVGEIPVPLTEECATKLISKCEKSPFGHNMETKMDEKVRKSWQLQPEHVQFTNPEWQVGLDKLIKRISNRLGYEDVLLQCSLYKVLVYTEGGHFVKHQDTEKEDGMIATLVVQPPSLHKGGDLVVYRDGDLMYRHDFGKENSTAAYFPHYAVHYADAEHALEKVTSGYRLVVVYSICLPAKVEHLKQRYRYDNAFLKDLSSAMSEMGSEVDLFTLLLTHEYTPKSIGDFGCGALKGIDRARFAALEEANGIVLTEKKLQFYIAQLTHEIHYGQDGMGDWKIWLPREESVTWFSTDGQIIGVKKNVKKLDAQEYKEPPKFNILNPDQDTFFKMWRYHGETSGELYTGNEGTRMDTTYCRYAVVAWAGTNDVEKTMEVFGPDAAMTVLQTHKQVDTGSLRSFMAHAAIEVSEAASHKLGKLLVDVGEAALVNLFFQRFCEVDLQKEVPPFIIELVRAYKWEDIGVSFVTWLDCDEDVKKINAALQIVDGLSTGESKNALLEYAMDKICKLNTKELRILSSSKLLWKWVIRSGNDSAFRVLVEALESELTSRNGRAIAAFTSQLSEMDPTDDRIKTFAPIAATRIRWIEDRCSSQELDQPFSWEMPDAKFAQDVHFHEEFLRGPEISTTTKGFHNFKSFRTATNYAAECTRGKQIGFSVEMEAVEGEDGIPFVKIEKTKEWFTRSQKRLKKFRQEMENLNRSYEHVFANGVPKKRARLE